MWGSVADDECHFDKTVDFVKELFCLKIHFIILAKRSKQNPNSPNLRDRLCSQS